MYYQAIIVTLLVSSVFINAERGNGTYWLLTALAAQLYMLMYLLMFAAGIYLRDTNIPDERDRFKVTGTK